MDDYYEKQRLIEEAAYEIIMVTIYLIKDIIIGQNDIRSLLLVKIRASGLLYTTYLPELKPRKWIRANTRMLQRMGWIPEKHRFIGVLPKAFIVRTKKMLDFYGIEYQNQKQDKRIKEWLLKIKADIQTPSLEDMSPISVL